MAKEKVVYTEEQKAAVLAQVETDGIHKAAKAAGIPWQTVTKWAADAGLSKARDKAAAAEIEAKKNSRAKARNAKEKVEKAARKTGEGAKKAAEDAKETAEAVKAVAEDAKAAAEIETKKNVKAAGRKVKKAAADMAAKAEHEIGINIVIQSENGHAITTKQISEMVPKKTSDVYVKAEEGKLYYVLKDGTAGSVDLW